MKECRQTKIFFPKVQGGKINKLAKLSKQKLNLLIQIGTGHALVAKHMSHWTNMETTCKLCEEGFESTEHLYFQCPKLELSRRELTQSTKTYEEKLIMFFSMKALTDLFEERARGGNTRLH